MIVPVESTEPAKHQPRHDATKLLGWLAGLAVLAACFLLISMFAEAPLVDLAIGLLILLGAGALIAVGGRLLIFALRGQRDEDLVRFEEEANRARQATSRFIDASGNDIRHHLQTLNLLNAALCKLADTRKTREIAAKQGIAITQLGEFMDSLLEFNELESGDVELEIGDIPIADTLQKLEQEFEYQARAKGLDLSFDYQNCVARTDPRLLSRIIRVLVSNAIRYTNEGSVRVSAQCEPGYLNISVTDTGIGIAPDQLSRIFDVFYRVDNSPARREGGLGLGLSIVERSVRHLDAELEVESEPGRGSTFSLRIPAAV